MGPLLTIAFLLLCGIFAVIFQQGFIILFLGMLPAMAAFIGDNGIGRYRFKTIFAINLSGVAPFMSEMLRQGVHGDTVRIMLSDAFMWLVIYGSAAIGWCILWSAPLTVKYVLYIFSKRRIEALEQRQQKLVESWGEEVTRSIKKTSGS